MQNHIRSLIPWQVSEKICQFREKLWMDVFPAMSGWFKKRKKNAEQHTKDSA